MLITVLAPGSRGDVEPYVALSAGLTQAGHQVRLVSHEDMRALVSGRGVEFWPLTVRVRDIAESTEMRQLLSKGNFLSVLRQMSAEAKRGAVHLAQTGLAAARDADLVIAGIGGLFTGLAVAEKVGVPLLQAHYAPLTPTADLPSFLLQGARTPRFLNRLSYHVARQMIWQAFRPADSLSRSEVLDLPRAPVLGPFDSPATLGAPVLYGFSPEVIRRPTDWGANIHVTGYWFLDSQTGWTPPLELERFLEAGPPPVYIGFGSMSSEDPNQTATLILDALSRSGQRGIVQCGWGAVSSALLPPSVYSLESAPFSWLFPRVAAVVHHGGAGTTAAALRSGVPAVVVPFFGDQPFWGSRVASLGVSPPPIPRRRLTAERLAQAILLAVTDREMRLRAEQVGRKIRGEDGVGRAVNIITSFMASRGSDK